MSFYKNKKVVVTGGAGFIGSHIVEKLVACDAQVTVIDNLRTGNLENLNTVISDITIINGDIRDKELCTKALIGADAVFHLAAQVSVPESVEDPETCFSINVNGTFNLLEAARINKAKRFIFSSSCAVYGEHTGPCAETSACHPTSPYAYSKFIGEQLCQQYSQVFNVPAVVLRYFNVFGPRQNPHSEYAGVIAKFTELIKQNKQITIFGNGTQSRDFVPVKQVVEANLLFAQLPDDLCTGSPINVATGKSISVLELVEKLKNNCHDYQHQAQFAPARHGELKHSQADCRRYRMLFAQIKRSRTIPLRQGFGGLRSPQRGSSKK